MSNHLVTIVMAIYKPNIEWLKIQLTSLNDQDYNHLELLVWNDCPEDNKYENIFRQFITRFPYKIMQGKRNLGSNGAFEQLTKMAKGNYIAYCDQDDKWHTDKISTLIQLMRDESATLSCSDMCVIDRNGNQIADKIERLRPHQTFVEGKGQLETLLVRNFVTGCTMIVDSEMAKNAIPFPKQMVHDHWLALWNAIYGKISIFHGSLIDYRLHGDNQTEMLAGIKTKTDYFKIRCLPYYDRLYALRMRKLDSFVADMVEQKYEWAKLRVEYYRKPGIRKFFKLLKKISINQTTTGFELMLPIMPQVLFKWIILNIKKGNI